MSAWEANSVAARNEIYLFSPVVNKNLVVSTGKFPLLIVMFLKPT